MDGSHGSMGSEWLVALWAWSAASISNAGAHLALGSGSRHAAGNHPLWTDTLFIFLARLSLSILFGHSVHLLFISGMLYLHQLNYAIRRLAFMIPDPTLRQDTELFTGLNRRVLSFLMGLGMFYWSMGWLTAIPAPLYALLKIVDHLIPVAVVLLMVMPVSMTMTMVWKLKESIFAVLDERTSGSRVSD